MPPDPPAMRRARRLVDQLTIGLSSVCLGAATRDLERLDQREPLEPGEIALGRGVNTLLMSRLLWQRGFRRNGHNGGGGLHREPVYTRSD